jgi:glycosyltransferase involved in cell wall biosynthesis
MRETGSHWLVPGSIEQVTGGYRYDRLIVEGLRRAGHPVAVHELPGAYPFPDEGAIRAAEAALDGLPDGAAAVLDGLALPGVARAIGRAGRRLRLLALVHHPLSLETGLGPEEAARLERVERDCLAQAARVVVTSRHTAEVLGRFGVEGGRIGVVEPGVDRPARPARGSGGASGGASGDGEGPSLLCVATLTPRKGHLVLVEALARLRHLPWRLTCAGSAERDPACAAAVRAAIGRLGLEGRVDLAGEVPPEAMGALYDGADLFVLASHYEGYGMAFAEALAWGLPVVGTTAGAVPTVVPAGAGVLVPPGDPAALAAALAPLLSGPGARSSLREGASAAAAALADWDGQARRFLAEILRVPGPSGGA